MDTHNQNPTHTPEPWCVVDDTRIYGKGAEVTFVSGLHANYDEDAANAARIVACVNALNGVDDPAATIQAARNVLALLRVELEAAYRSGKIPPLGYVTAGNVLADLGGPVVLPTCALCDGLIDLASEVVTGPASSPHGRVLWSDETAHASCCAAAMSGGAS